MIELCQLDPWSVLDPFWAQMLRGSPVQGPPGQTALKGGLMNRTLTVITLVVLAAALTGCSKTPWNTNNDNTPANFQSAAQPLGLEGTKKDAADSAPAQHSLVVRKDGQEVVAIETSDKGAFEDAARKIICDNCPPKAKATPAHHHKATATAPRPAPAPVATAHAEAEATATTPVAQPVAPAAEVPETPCYRCMACTERTGKDACFGSLNLLQAHMDAHHVPPEARQLRRLQPPRTASPMVRPQGRCCQVDAPCGDHRRQPPRKWRAGWPSRDGWYMGLDARAGVHSR